MIRFTTLFCKNRAGSVAAAIAVLLLLAIAGCFHLNPDAPGTEKANIGWNLKSRNTKVLLLTHLGHESFSPPAPPPRAEGPYHLKIRWLPGQIRFDAAVLTELLGNQAGQSHREKVIQVVIISPYNLIAGKRGEERFHPSQLDEAEARDLDIALSYFSSMATKWAKKKPYPNQELTYVARDSLRSCCPSMMTVLRSFSGTETILPEQR